MGPENSKEYLKFKDTLEKNNIPVVHLHKGNFSKHIPNVNLAEGSAALVDITAGVLFADRALKTAQVWWLLSLAKNLRQDRLSFLHANKVDGAHPKVTLSGRKIYSWCPEWELKK